MGSTSGIQSYIIISFVIFVAFAAIICYLFVTLLVKRTLLHRAQEELKAVNANLEQIVLERTDRIKELERQRAEIEKAAATGRMAARIAHEINNPLSGIKNAFQLLSDAIPREHDYYSYVGRIDKEIDRIAQIVRQMYSLYKPEHEAAAQFSLRETITDIIALQEAVCQDRRIKVDLEMSARNDSVILPENLFRQIIYNVFMNAVEVSPPESVISIKVGINREKLDLSIADQGDGIPDEIRSNIFEPFFTTKSHLAKAGLGLGLSVTKSLVEVLKGKIYFESTQGKGTTFYISFPLGAFEEEVSNG